jgi:hypothetical protein
MNQIVGRIDENSIKLFTRIDLECIDDPNAVFIFNITTFADGFQILSQRIGNSVTILNTESIGPESRQTQISPQF